jgi:hypothetical protein
MDMIISNCIRLCKGISLVREKHYSQCRCMRSHGFSIVSRLLIFMRLSFDFSNDVTHADSFSDGVSAIKSIVSESCCRV